MRGAEPARSRPVPFPPRRPKTCMSGPWLQSRGSRRHLHCFRKCAWPCNDGSRVLHSLADPSAPDGREPETRTMIQALLACLPLSAAPSLAPAQEAKPLKPWTILVYGGADNNADGPILFFLDQVRKAIDDDPGIELLLLLDRSEKFSNDATILGEDFTGARLYRLKKDSAERLSGGKEFPELTLGEDAELDS